MKLEITLLVEGDIVTSLKIAAGTLGVSISDVIIKALNQQDFFGRLREQYPSEDITGIRDVIKTKNEELELVSKGDKLSGTGKEV